MTLLSPPLTVTSPIVPPSAVTVMPRSGRACVAPVPGVMVTFGPTAVGEAAAPPPDEDEPGEPDPELPEQADSTRVSAAAVIVAPAAPRHQDDLLTCRTLTASLHRARSSWIPYWTDVRSTPEVAPSQYPRRPAGTNPWPAAPGPGGPPVPPPAGRSSPR